MESSELFASREERLTYRAITQCLQTLERSDTLELLSDSVSLRIENQNAFKQKRSADNAFYDVLNNLVNLMVRGMEIVAAMPTGNTTVNLNVSSGQTAVDEFAEKDPECILLAKNPRRSEHTAAPQGPAPVIHKVQVKALTRKTLSVPTNFSIMAWFQDGRNWFAEQGRKKSKVSARVSWEFHVNMLNSLILSYYQQSTKEGKMQISELLQQFVTLSCCQKIRARVSDGKSNPRNKKGKNLFQILTSDWSNLPERYGPWLTHPVGESRYTLLKSLGVAKSDFTPESPVWDANGRLVFGKALAKTLMELDVAVNDTMNTFVTLQNQIRPGHFQKANPELSKELERVASLLATKLHTFESLLWLYKHSEDGQDLVKSYLEWLEVAAELTASKITPISATAEEYSDREELRDLAEEHETQRGSWAVVARRYLDLVALHWKSLRYPTDAGQKLQDRIKNFMKVIQINLVHVEPAHQDVELPNIWNCMETRGSAGGNMEFPKKMEAWLKGVNLATAFKNTKAFAGTLHCELILLALFLLAGEAKKDCRYFQQLNNSEFQIDANQLAVFHDMSSLLAVSKRCCPSCATLVTAIRSEQRMDHDGSKQLIYAGYHRAFSAVDLPPFLPRKYFLILLKAAEERLALWIKYIDKAGPAKRGRREHSSDETDPTASSSPERPMVSLRSKEKSSTKMSRMPNISEADEED